jgi:hypothetical protein
LIFGPTDFFTAALTNPLAHMTLRFLLFFIASLSCRLLL